MNARQSRPFLDRAKAKGKARFDSIGRARPRWMVRTCCGRTIYRRGDMERHQASSEHMHKTGRVV